jgi:hypothetical protein
MHYNILRQDYEETNEQSQVSLLFVHMYSATAKQIAENTWYIRY